MNIRNICAFKKALINLFYFSTLTILWLFLYIVFSPVDHADALQAKVFPSRMRQGDAFMIRVSGLKGSTEPSAIFNKEPLRFSSCGKGCFVALGVVDVNAKPHAYRIPLKIGKRKTILRLRVSLGRFDTISLTLPEDKVSPRPEDIERINREADLLNSIWEINSEKLWEGKFVLPLENPLSTPFGTKRIINGVAVSIHRGLDITGAEGEQIHASNTGRVVLTEELFFGGNTVILDHGQGVYTVYMHMSGFNVSPGDLVSKNDVLGFVGSTGRSNGPHLHFGVKVSGINTNPLSLAGLRL
jgi:hypothetical protein